MENFDYVSPTTFVFGKDAEKKVGEKLSGLGARKVLLHYGGGSAVKSGLIDRVVASLDSSGIEHVELGGVRPNPEIGLVREGVKICKEEQIDWVLAVGGGSVIDSSKAIANGACIDRDVWELFESKQENADVLPIAVVLTIPASGSEASWSAVISNDAIGMKTSYKSNYQRPKLAFMNPELTYTLPAYQTAAGLVDMYCHVLERYFDDCGEVRVTDNLAVSLMRTVVEAGPAVLENPYDYEARANVMWTGTLCHQGLAGLGRHEDWACHGLEHELSAYDTSITHGAGLAVMFPAWMRFVHDENPERFAKYGYSVFDIAPSGDVEVDAVEAIDRTQRFFASLGMPTTLEQLGIAPEDLDDVIDGMLPTLKANKGEPFGSFKKLTMEDAATIYRIAAS